MQLFVAVWGGLEKGSSLGGEILVMGMASRGGSSCAFVCSQRPLLLWAQPNNQPEVVASGKSRQTGSRCRAVGSMLNRWTMMAIVGRRWAKRGRLLAGSSKERL